MTVPPAGRWLLVVLSLGGAVAGGAAWIGAPRPIPLDAASLAHVTGMLAGYLSAVMLVLMARIPFLENRVGADVVARWHGLGGRLFLALTLIHVGAATQAWAESRQQSVPAAVDSLLALPQLWPAAVSTALFLIIAAVSIRSARRRVAYETWHLVHLLTYVAVCLAFLHELAGPNLAGHRAVQVAWTLMHVYALTLVLRYRVIAPLEAAWRHRLTVAAVIPEAEGVASIIIHGRHVDELGAEPGQFLRWRFLTAGLWRTGHPFSLSAPRHGDFLRITVKAFGDGSRRVHTVRPGTRVLAEGPSGAMTARRRSRPSVLLIAGGIGITPMRALFETLHVDPHQGALTLLYRASSPEDVVFRTELEQLARRRGANIIWMVGSSRLPQLSMTADNLLRRVPDLVDRDVFLCASPTLATATRDALRDAGLPARQLHEETFAF